MGSFERQEANTGHLACMWGKGGGGVRTPHVRRSHPKPPPAQPPQATGLTLQQWPHHTEAQAPHSWHPQHSTDPAVVVNAHEGQGGPGELHGLEVDGGACGPGALESWLVYRARGGRAVEDGHGLQ